MPSKPDHIERTAAEPRDKSLHTVILQHVEDVNDTTRIFRLGIPPNSPPIRFLPGQWLDVYVPSVEKAGGFTITSTPREARLAHPTPEPEGAGQTRSPCGESENRKAVQGPYLELAVQKSPDSPSAAWLWQDPHPPAAHHQGLGSSPDSVPSPIIGKELRVRVGGSFVWPPPGINVRALRRVVFVAGGVGVNPLVSMLCSLASSAAATPKTIGAELEVRFLYSLRDPGVFAGKPGYREARNMLFLERIAHVFRQGRVKGGLEVFLTSGGDTAANEDEGDGENVIAVGGQAAGGNGDGESGSFTIPFYPRRCTIENDVAKAVDNPRFAVVYVCGVPTMTDEFVARLAGREDEGGLGMEPHRVLCEKWW